MDENCEPFDGVLPTDFPEVYATILAWRCYRKKASIDKFYIGQDAYKTICSECYKPELFGRNEIVETHLDWHETGTPFYPAFKCDICEKTLTVAQDVIKCGSCTEFLLS